MAELTNPAVQSGTSACCAPEAQTGCCTPSDKAECCTPESASCGCDAASTSEPDIRDR
jgi:hypothetical protein